MQEHRKLLILLVLGNRGARLFSRQTRACEIRHHDDLHQHGTMAGTVDETTTIDVARDALWHPEPSTLQLPAVPLNTRKGESVCPRMT